MTSPKIILFANPVSPLFGFFVVPPFVAFVSTIKGQKGIGNVARVFTLYDTFRIIKRPSNILIRFVAMKLVLFWGKQVVLH